MILFLGEKRYADFIREQGGESACDIAAENADKIIIAEYSENAKKAVLTAREKNIPLLGIVDGYKSVIEAFGGKVIDIENLDGVQEWAVIDATSPLYLQLESVIKVCRAKPFAMDENNPPDELDVMSRAEKGWVLAVRNWTAPKTYGNIYAINYYPDSEKTPDGKQIIKNFLNI